MWRGQDLRIRCGGNQQKNEAISLDRIARQIVYLCYNQGRRFLLAFCACMGMRMCAATVEAVGSDAFSVQRWTVADGLPGNIVTALEKSPNGSIKVMTSDGAAYFDGVRFSACRVEKCGDHGKIFPGQSGSCRLVESNGVQWVGTDGEGLLRILQRLVVPKVSQKNASGHVCFRDSSGRVWNGLDSEGVAVACQDGTARCFSASEGLLARDVTSFAETPDGDIWVGSNGSGLWRISGDSADALAVDLFASSAGMTAPRARLETGRSEALSFGSMDEVSFRYSADSPGIADCIEFATRLSPTENDWSAGGKERVRSFGLPQSGNGMSSLLNARAAGKKAV